VLVVAGLLTVPVITVCVLAYGYLLSPLYMPVLSPLGRFLPARLKETLS
jgi:CDP-diacylglycerol--serine O-phosphatidyltransferase